MARPRLLLAEDDEALSSLLEEYLREADYDVVTYRRGDTALEALRNERFDLVLSDIVMPGADGLMLLRHVRESEGDTLILLMTGYSGIENALHAVAEGAYDFVSKPFQLPEIRVRLDNAARYQQLLREYNRLVAGEGTNVSESPVGVPGIAAVKAYGKGSAGDI